MSFGLIDLLVIAATLALLVVLMLPKLRAKPGWRAAITPLASIIGSGFLVIGPVLAHVAGRWAVEAMLGLCALAWLFGSAIRFNIAGLDREPGTPHAAKAASDRFARWDRMSQLLLALAYFVSVAYYLNLLGAYLLKGFGVVDPVLARTATSLLVVGLGGLGFLHGFKGIERVEVIAVSFKLAVIGGLLLALLQHRFGGFDPGSVPISDESDGWTAMRVLLGCVLLVQGFETSRFLGHEYDARTRARSMRRAQLLSTGIYVAFIFLVLPLVPPGGIDVGSETEIVDIVATVAMVLGPMLVLAAIASQLSAAVADMGGSGGLLTEVSGGRVSARMAYVAITAVVLVLTWTVDIFSIIAFASRAFAAYYAIQCGLAAWLAEGRHSRRAWYSLGALLALAVVVLGKPAE